MAIEINNDELIPQHLRVAAAQIAQKAKRRGISNADIERVLGPSMGPVDSLIEVLTSSQIESPQETGLDMAKRLGILGCIKDAPADLSTNPKYLEGFGKNGTGRQD